MPDGDNLIVVASTNNTVLVGASTGLFANSIVDSKGNVWSITLSGQVAVNGVVDPTTTRVIALAYENGVVWQENADRLWWSKTSPSAHWSPTYGTSQSPIAPGATIPGVTYLDGAIVYYTNTVAPALYNVTTVSEGSKGVTFVYAGNSKNGGMIHNAEGSLNLNVTGILNNTGSIITQGGIGSATTNIYIDYGHSFVNNGSITVNGASAGHVQGTLWIEMTTTGSTFQNNGVMTASGVGQTINIWSASGLAFDSNAVNNGSINVIGGATVFIMAPLITSTGTGAVSASGGSRIHVDAPVGPGEVFNLNGNSVLEFGTGGSVARPAMQFLGTINGNLVGSTLLLDGIYGTTESFKVDSTAGAGLGELLVYDRTHALVADLRFTGHYQLADFSLTPVAGSTPINNYTAVTFSLHPNTPGVLHS